MEKIGQGVQADVLKDKIILELDTSGKGTISASGKSLVFATTRGNVKLDNGFVLGLNLYKSNR